MIWSILIISNLWLGSTGAVLAACPPDAHVEPEECGADVNGGCAAGWLFWEAVCGDAWCGTGYADAGMRDTDWYLLELPDPDGDGMELLSSTLQSDFPGVTFILDGVLECNPQIIATGCGDAGQSLVPASIELPAPETYVVFVATGACDGSGIFEGYPCGSQNDYTVTIECGDTCAADLDGDDAVGVNDLLQLIAQWGPCPGCAADLNGDNLVGVNDLLALLAAWGAC